MEQCRAQGLAGSDRVIVDSTDLAANTEVLRRSHVQRRATKKLIKAVAVENAELARQLAASVSKYDPDVEDTERRLRANADLECTITAVKEALDNGRLTTPNVRQRLETAQQIATGVASSTTDPEARFGRKGRLGYQQQLAMTEKNEIIVGVRVTSGDQPDVAQLLPLVDEIQLEHPGITQSISADKGYDSGKNRAQIQGQGIQTYIAVGQPESERVKEKGLFTSADFELEADGQLRCPAGKKSSRTAREPDRDATTYIFRAKEVRFHGLRRARYRGLLYVTIQALLTAVAVNAKRMAALPCPPPVRTT